MTREKVSEWWEVWWRKRGATPCRMRAYGYPNDPRIGQEGFVSREEAQTYILQAQNKYHRIVHVVRYRRAEKESTDR